MFALAGPIFLALQVAGGNAEQRNRIIHAGDYDIFQVGRAQGWGACERACNGDPRCKAWTFIRSNRQCRLKYMAGRSVRNNCCVSGVKRRAAGGDGRRQFCSDYATEAVRAQEQNLRNRCGFRGARWNADYSPHYQFCMRVDRSEPNEETRQRARMINNCVSHAGNSRKKRCNHYARIAVEQAKTNARAGCGFKGSRWTTNRRRHVVHCRNTSWGTARDDTNSREQRLRSCLALQ